LELAIEPHTRLRSILCAVVLAGVGAALSAQEPRGARVLGASIYSQDGSVAVIQSRFEGATEMRLGNTVEEMRLAAWEPFISERIWYLPGFSYRTQPIVHAQYRGPALNIEIQVPVMPAEAAGLPDGEAFPAVIVPDSRASDLIATQNFDTWHERWSTYQDAYGYGNVFYPLTHQRRGGVADSGFVWTDASRWLVDAPESPPSILVALTYWRWMFSSAWRARTGFGDSVDLTNATLQVDLRGRRLALGTSYLTFWVLCGGARWHHVQELEVTNGVWITNQMKLSPDESQWTLSWSRGGAAASFCLDRVESYGFAFRGFTRGETPAGVLDIDEFKLIAGATETARRN
jgi:hypothetical protein